jgi:hypothetical protein
MGEMITTYKILNGKSQRRLLGRPRSARSDNIKINLGETE